MSLTMKKRSPLEIRQEKQQEMEKFLTKGRPFITHPEKIPTLKETSRLRKFCASAALYLTGLKSKDNGMIYQGCVQLYKLFRVNPNKRNDKTFADLIKQRLKSINQPTASQQELFS